jgi:hypothetical protein
MTSPTQHSEEILKRSLFEHFSQPLVPTEIYVKRVLRRGGLVLVFLAFSLALGMVGYRLVANLSWVDAFLNASMILTGMGPVNPMTSSRAKIFSGLYAIYSGVGFLTAMGLLFAPVLHRFLHKVHLSR